jgi:hypothetical protein
MPPLTMMSEIKHEDHDDEGLTDAPPQPIPTVWTAVVSEVRPPGVLDRIEGLSDEQLAQAAELALQESRARLDAYLEPYRTPISDETLSQILD